MVTVLTAAVWFALFRNLVESPRGAEFRVLGSGEALSSSLGISTYRLKLKTYAIGALPAGLAGCLFAYLDGYVAASSFGLHATLMILAAGVLGGLHTVYGSLLGAALMLLGPMSSSAFDDYSFVVFGLFLLLGGVFLPKGITPLLGRALRRVGLGPRPAVRATALPESRDADFAPVSGGRLSVHGATKSFGGVHALTDASLEAEPGRVTALIGPNGSGKTTLLNVISGYYRADEGRGARRPRARRCRRTPPRPRRGRDPRFRPRPSRTNSRCGRSSARVRSALRSDCSRPCSACPPTGDGSARRPARWTPS